MDVGPSLVQYPAPEVEALAVRISQCTALAYIDPITAELLGALFPYATYVRSARMLDDVLCSDHGLDSPR